MGRGCNILDRSGMCTTLWAENPEGKRPLRRSRHRWEYSIKIDLNEIR
jgi:hypothetical protein